MSEMGFFTNDPNEAHPTCSAFINLPRVAPKMARQQDQLDIRNTSGIETRLGEGERTTSITRPRIAPSMFREL
jgi:hypothetical protein